MILRRKEYVVNKDARQFLDFIPPVSILLGGLIFLIGTSLAILSYSTVEGGYKFFEQFFSELGVRKDYLAELSDGTTENRYAPPHPDYFNITLYASGFLMIPFFFYSYRQFRNKSLISNYFLFLAIASGVVAGPMMVGVGIFDLSVSSSSIFKEHGFWVAWLYILIAITSVAWFIMLLFAKNLPYKKAKWRIMDYLLLLILVIMAVLNLADGLKIIFVKDISFINTYTVETYQKFIAYLFFIYYGLIVGVRLTKTKYDNTPVIEKGNYFCTNCGSLNPDNAKFCKDCLVKMV